MFAIRTALATPLFLTAATAALASPPPNQGSADQGLSLLGPSGFLPRRRARFH